MTKDSRHMQSAVDLSKAEETKVGHACIAIALGPCRSPIACEAMGYCRELNFKHGTPQFSERLPDGCFQAWAGDYDLDITTGYGKTQLEAAIDLMSRLEGK
jgi:hypothetical protein